MNPRIRATTALARVAVATISSSTRRKNLRLEIISGEQSQARAAVIDYRGQRLLDLVGYGRCQSPMLSVGKPGQAPLRHVQCLLCFLPIVQNPRRLPNHFDDPTFSVPQRQSAGNTPTIFWSGRDSADALERRGTTVRLIIVTSACLTTQDYPQSRSEGQAG